MAKQRELLSSEQIEALRARAQRAIAPLLPAQRGKPYKVGEQRTKAGQELTEYYLVHFLLVELLGFLRHGASEKVAWTIPVDFDGSFALVEHRKMGLGVFSAPGPDQEAIAGEIVLSIKRGIKVARPFFDHLASLAMQKSKLNVVNTSGWLFERYEYIRALFEAKSQEAWNRREEVHIEKHEYPNGATGTSYSYPSFQLRKESTWLGLSAIEAFFSWMEHVLIHIAILRCKIRTGAEVADLTQAEWSVKVKSALDGSDGNIKTLIDDLTTIRRQIRNFMAHGAFGKQGEAFSFHSAAGAVPVILNEKTGIGRYSVWENPMFNEAEALKRIDAFIENLWKGDLEPAKLHIQDAGLPTIMPYASDGTYAHAMCSVHNMEGLVEYLTRAIDDSANMDW